MPSDPLLDAARPRSRSAQSSRERRHAARATASSARAVPAGVRGGSYRPLSESDIRRIHDRALDVLERVGMAEPIPAMAQRALDRGCHLSEQGRLCFPRGFVEDVIAGACRHFTLHGRDPRHDLQLGGDRVYYATCGEAVRVLDPGSNDYRPSTLTDVYDFARLVDSLDHIHEFAQTIIATELSEDSRKHDINVAYAMMSGTAKHCSIAMTDVGNLGEVFAMAHIFAGGEDAFRARPFLSVGQCPVVSPLKFGEENSRILAAAVQYGVPVEYAVVPQSGATGPAALAGNLVLSTAETLAALILVNLFSPGHPAIVGNWPFVSDLRTGAFSGGSGEEAVMSAAAAQIINHYDLPSHTAAGMSDAKLPDAQAGYEKALTNALAGFAGCNLVSEAAGMLGSLICCSFEAMVIDNDMLGAIQRAIRGIEVNEETLSFEVIRDAALGAGHFLGQAQTLSLMETEYLYPETADRHNYDEWKLRGGLDARQRAARRVQEILSTHFPAHNDRAADERVRLNLPILLPPDAMCRESSRWRSV